MAKKESLGSVFDFDDEDKKIGAISTKKKEGLLDTFLEPKKDERIQTSIYVYEKFIKALDEEVDDLKRQARKQNKEKDLKLSRNRLIEHIFEQYFYNKNNK